MKAALPKRRSFICDYLRLAYHLPTFNTHKRYAGTLLFVSNSCTVICFVRCSTRNPRPSASGQTQSKTRTTDFFCLTFSNQSLMWTFRFQWENSEHGMYFSTGQGGSFTCWRRAMALYYKQMSFCQRYSDLFIVIINSDDNHIIMIVQRLSWFYDGNMK